MASKERQSNIELLRILASMGVIVLHYNNPLIGGVLRMLKKARQTSIFYTYWSPCLHAV